MSTPATASAPVETPDPFAADAQEPEKPAPESPLDDVERQIEHRTWKFAGSIKFVNRGQEVEEQIEREYVQKPLSYLAMIQFTGLIGRKIDEAMAGPEGLTVEAVSEVAEVAQVAATGGLTRGDFAGIDSFVRGFAKLASYVPDVIEEAMCIWLRVPFRDRMLVREIWAKPVDEGGLSNDEGEEMMTLFIAQNYEELERFFSERLRRMARTVQRERRRLHPSLPAQDSQPSSS